MNTRRALCLLLGVCLLAGVFFTLKLQLDNKYTAAGPQAQSGFLRLPDGPPGVLFLRDGWEFYPERLDPDQLAAGARQPTQTVSLGRYGVFDPEAPYGSGTYRLTILTGGVPRRYMLELPEIYTRYDLYINGDLAWSAGEPGRIATQQTRITFTASGSIDLMFGVENEGFWSGGFVFPPAFGDPLAVGRLLDARLMIATAVCALALLTAILHLVIGFRARKGCVALSFALLCLALILCVGRIPIHTLGLPGLLWYRLESLGNYAMILALLLTHGQVCAVPRPVSRAAAVLGLLFCAVAFCGSAPAIAAGLPGLFLYSGVLDLYRWAAALYLVFTTIWYTRKAPPKILALACGYCFFGAALLADRLVPLYEPILSFWPIETAGLLLLLLLSGILAADALAAIRESASARVEARLFAQLDAARKAQFQQLLDHQEQVRRLRHELQIGRAHV